MGAWGYGLFQSDNDYDRVSDLAYELGLYKLEEEAQAKAQVDGEKEEVYDRINYSIYAPHCSDLDLVRKHLNAGALEQLIKAKEAEMLNPTENWNNPCYVYVLLGACAMTLGCPLPDSYMAILKKVYTEVGLMPEAVNQMKKALFGPDGYKNGIPYDLESKGLVETMGSMDLHSHDDQYRHYSLINKPPIYIGNSSTSVTLKELRDKHNNPDACGGCGAKSGEVPTLLRCGGCKDRKYCSSECQQKHWKVHKKVCEPMQK